MLQSPGHLATERPLLIKTLDFIKQISSKSGDSYNIRETGKFLSNFINELKIQYEIKE